VCAGFKKTVVVKVIHHNLAQSIEFVDMLLDEARIATDVLCAVESIT